MKNINDLLEDDVCNRGFLKLYIRSLSCFWRNHEVMNIFCHLGGWGVVDPHVTLDLMAFSCLEDQATVVEVKGWGFEGLKVCPPACAPSHILCSSPPRGRV